MKFKRQQKTIRPEDSREVKKNNVDQGRAERLFSVNSTITKKKYLFFFLLLAGICIFLFVNCVRNYLPVLIKTTFTKPESIKWKYVFQLDFSSSGTWQFLLAYFIFYSIFCFIVLYKININFKQLNIGQKGDTRWTTDEELKEQYHAVDQIITNPQYVYYIEGQNEVEQKNNYELLYNSTFDQLAEFIKNNINELEKHKIELKVRRDLTNFDESIKSTWKMLKEATEKLNSDGFMETSFYDKLSDLKKKFRELRGMKAPYDYVGDPGIPISWDRESNKIFIDQTYTNFLFQGVSRSGKGEVFVIPMMDILSRVKDKPSEIILDPKLENYKMAADTYQKRGYITWCLNLINPKYSVGYNPLYLVKLYFVKEEFSQAELLCKTVATSIYNPNKEGEDSFWDDNSIACFTAMVLAMSDDCLKADKVLNTQFHEKKDEVLSTLYTQEFDEAIKDKSESFKNKVLDVGLMLLISKIIKRKDLNRQQQMTLFDLSIGEYKLLDQSIEEIMEKTLLSKTEVSDGALAYFIHENYDKKISYYEQKINLYSMQMTFSHLQRQKLEGDDTMLNIYFNSRDELDRAKLKWTSIEVAGDKTKGSIFSSMLTQLEVFTYEEIARITSTNDIDLSLLGFGKRPIALFIGVPDYDHAFHFLCTILISQAYYVNSQRANELKGYCDRPIIFIDDEIFNCPAINDFQGMLNVHLGRHMKSVLFAQSLSQIPLRYGEKESKSIIGACHNRIYILLGNYDEAEEASKEIGTETILNLNRSGHRFSLNKTFTEMYDSEPLCTANNLQELAEGESVVKRILHRKNLDGTDHIQTPIFNRYNRRAKLRYQYLTRDFPNPDEVDLIAGEFLMKNNTELTSKVFNFTSWMNNYLSQGESAKQQAELLWAMSIRKAIEKNSKFALKWNEAKENTLQVLFNANVINEEELLDLKVGVFFQIYIHGNDLANRYYPRQNAELKSIFESFLIREKRKYEQSLSEVDPNEFQFDVIN